MKDIEDKLKEYGKRIERLEKTVKHFIVWSQRELGEESAKELIAMLDEEPQQETEQ